MYSKETKREPFENREKKKHVQNNLKSKRETQTERQFISCMKNHFEIICSSSSLFHENSFWFSSNPFLLSICSLCDEASFWRNFLRNTQYFWFCEWFFWIQFQLVQAWLSSLAEFVLQEWKMNRKKKEWNED